MKETTIKSKIVQYRGVKLQLRTLLNRPRCEQLVPESLGYEDVKNFLQLKETVNELIKIGYIVLRASLFH
jgi:hypothetical protein